MIENYYNVEFDNVIFDIDNKQEWLEMMNELGLSNQTNFLKNSKSPVPFPLLNNNTKNIFLSNRLISVYTFSNSIITSAEKVIVTMLTNESLKN